MNAINTIFRLLPRGWRGRLVAAFYKIIPCNRNPLASTLPFFALVRGHFRVLK
jgi:hypothetical protein